MRKLSYTRGIVLEPKFVLIESLKTRQGEEMGTGV